MGGGPTGVEFAGALADLIADTMSRRVPRPGGHGGADPPRRPRPRRCSAPFSDSAHDYVAKVLGRKGVGCTSASAVTEVGPGHVTLADGSTIRTRCVVWGGGIMAPPLAAAAGLPQGRGGRIDVLARPHRRRRAGRLRGRRHRQHPDAPTASRIRSWARSRCRAGPGRPTTSLADLAGKPRKAFHYKDKGIMAMIGRGAAIAEVGPHRHELHGAIAFSAWLGVHAALMTGVRTRVDAFVDWGSDYFSAHRGPQVLDRSDAARIDWTEDAAPPKVPAGV